MCMRVLVVDDDPHILGLVKYNLEKYRYEVITAADGMEALQLARKFRPRLIILDLMLPVKDGFEVCRELRADASTAAIPIIILTARDQEFDKVLGFELGADDYVTKPFSPRELVARVKAQIRRAGMAFNAGEQDEEHIRIGDLVIYPERFEVYVRGKPVRLSRKEFQILHLMASHPGKVFTREQLIDLVWGYDYVVGDARTVDVHIRYLRRKIEPDASKPQYIETVRGLGYRFKDLRKAGA